MSNYSLAILLQSTSCQPHTLIIGSHGVQKKSRFYDLGHLGKQGHRSLRDLKGSRKNCLDLLTMNWELSGELISTLVSMSPFRTALI